MASKAMKQEALAYLRAHPLCVLATATKSGKPQAATIWGVMTRKMEFFFMTSKVSRKAKNIAKNSKVAIVVGTDFDPRTVQIEGKAKAITKEKDIQKFWDDLTASPQFKKIYFGNLRPQNPFPPDREAEYGLFKVDIDWMRYMHLSPKTKLVEYEMIIGTWKK